MRAAELDIAIGQHFAFHLQRYALGHAGYGEVAGGLYGEISTAFVDGFYFGKFEGDLRVFVGFERFPGFVVHRLAFGTYDRFGVHFHAQIADALDGVFVGCYIAFGYYSIHVGFPGVQGGSAGYGHFETLDTVSGLSKEKHAGCKHKDSH